MFESGQKTLTPTSNLSDDLLQFYNEFSVFNEYYAFFCDAFAGVVSLDEVLDANTVLGINRCSRWMKCRLEEFKEQLETIERKSRSVES